MPKASTKKSKKTNAVGAGEFAAMRKKLDQQREEILSMYEHDLRVGQESTDNGAEDLIDRATSAYNREFMLSLSGSERKILLQIENALRRLDDGSYGVCINCDEKIAKKRLQAVPWARYCIECQELVEQGILQEN